MPHRDPDGGVGGMERKKRKRKLTGLGLSPATSVPLLPIQSPSALPLTEVSFALLARRVIKRSPTARYPSYPTKKNQGWGTTSAPGQIIHFTPRSGLSWPRYLHLDDADSNYERAHAHPAGSHVCGAPTPRKKRLINQKTTQVQLWGFHTAGTRVRGERARQRRDRARPSTPETAGRGYRWSRLCRRRGV